LRNIQAHKVPGYAAVPPCSLKAGLPVGPRWTAATDKQMEAPPNWPTVSVLVNCVLTHQQNLVLADVPRAICTRVCGKSVKSRVFATPEYRPADRRYLLALAATSCPRWANAKSIPHCRGHSSAPLIDLDLPATTSAIWT